jgi:hypothetical protein
MKVKMILPALTEATSPFFRPIKYSLFPPLGLATLAAYLGDEADVEIQDEHVETLDLDDTPDLVVIQVYITSAYRAYRIADHYRRAVRTWSSADCTSRRCPPRLGRMRTRSFWVLARTRGRGSSAISGEAAPSACINRRFEPLLPFRRFGAI